MDLVFEGIILAVLVLVMCILLIYVLFTRFGAFVIRYGEKNAREDNFSSIDFKNEDYYREILKEYSVAELSYIDDFKIDIKKDIVATLLNLKLKNKIEFTKKQIIVLDTNTAELKKTEKFILENIKEDRVKIHSSGQFQTYFMAEALEDGLISKNRDNKSKNGRKIYKGFIFPIIPFILSVLCNNNFNNLINLFGSEKIAIIVMLFLFVATGISLPATLIYFLIYSLVQSTLYSRTKKGEELNKKIEGLKKYILDYSNLDEKDKKGLMIWEEYLIYSVIFDINTTIVKELSSLIDIEREEGKLYMIEKMELQENQIMYIDNQKYVTINMIKYKKGNAILEKYKITDENNQSKWFIVEIDDKEKKNYYLYDEYKNEIPLTEDEIFIKNQKYKIYRKGDTTIREKFGIVNDRQLCMYYDYISPDGSNVLSFEHWTETTQLLIGTSLTADRIKIEEKNV